MHNNGDEDLGRDRQHKRRVVIGVLLIGFSVWWMAAVIGRHPKGFFTGRAVDISKAPLSRYVWRLSESDFEHLAEETPWDNYADTALKGIEPLGRATEIEIRARKALVQKGVPYLRREGGINGVYYEVRLDENGTMTEIADARALGILLTPIDTAAKAVTMVALTQAGLVRSGSRIVAKTLSIRQGFLVQAYHSNIFGCSNHLPTGVVFVVYKDGRTEMAAQENEGPRQQGYSCVD